MVFPSVDLRQVNVYRVLRTIFKRNKGICRYIFLQGLVQPSVKKSREYSLFYSISRVFPSLLASDISIDDGISWIMV